MVTARSERPRFFDGQYLGAADLAAAIDYSRELAREAALAGQCWGICVGLDLVEVANAAGSFDYFVLPGLAFDGYGRPIVVLAPAAVPASLFADFPSGNQPVWIRYDEAQNRGLRPGWQSCEAADAYARVRESFAIEAGPKTSIKDRQSGVEIGGALVEDARLALNAIDPDAALICDASVPHQTFPADTARWLVPLGAAAWIAGAPGSFGPRSGAAKKVSRTLRRYAGQVAESVFAADGVLRLRDRMTDRDDTKSPDEQCAASSVTTADLVNAPDPKDSSKTLNRLVGSELVWVEGHMRVTGDARLWGTRLELRDAKGLDGGIPLHLNRSATLNMSGGRDLEIALGANPDGKSRLLAGVLAPGTPMATKLQLKNDGKLAVGPLIPADVKSHTILATTEDNTSIAINCAAAKLAKLQFTAGPGLTETAHFAYDGATAKARISVGATIANATTFTTTGHVGVRIDDPVGLHIDANDLVVHNPAANVGLTLLNGENAMGSIHFADGVAGNADSRAGFVRYGHGPNRMQFGTLNAVRATIDSTGDLGLGTESPNARIDIRETASGRALKLNAGTIRAEDGGATTRLDLQPNGGGIGLHGTGANSNRALISGDGNLGLGTDAPGSSIHIKRINPEVTLDVIGVGQQARIAFAVAAGVRSTIAYDVASQATWFTNSGNVGITLRQDRVGINMNGVNPSNHLHVRGNISGAADNSGNHVALIENLAANNGDVLALRVGVNADSTSNFITFFDSSGAIGRIERGSLGDIPAGHTNRNQIQAGTFLRLISGGADFAECLTRADVEPIGPGRIVGVHDGQVSLVTRGADALLVTTDRAVIVGNAPMAEGMPSETVTMIGQVPVFVAGPVSSGDFILPSGANDGCGRAVAPHALSCGDAALVVGRAWESCNEFGLRRVLVAIGISGATSADAAVAMIEQQGATIAGLEAKVATLSARIGTADGSRA